MPDSPDASKPTSFTQSCRDLIRMLSYEDILSCTVYVPPMLFMVGPAAIAANSPFINVVLNALAGFALSWILHRMGHRLLTALPSERRAVYLSHSMRLPVTLTLTQFLWLLEILVAAGVFSGIVGKRLWLAGDTPSLLTSVACMTVGLGLYFLPVYLAKLWIRRHYPAMPLLSPTEDVVSRSFP